MPRKSGSLAGARAEKLSAPDLLAIREKASEHSMSGFDGERARSRVQELREDPTYRAAWLESLRSGQYASFTTYWAFDQSRWFEKHLAEIERRKKLLDVLEVYAPFAGRDVLVVGSGHGAEWIALAQRGARVVGLDLEWPVSRFARERARRHALVPAFALGDATRPPFAPGQFDWVFLRQIVEHVPRADQDAFLKATARLVREGGHLFVDAPNQWDPIDRHDSGLPLVHWLPRTLRRAIVRRLGREVPTLEPAAAGRHVPCHDFPSPRTLRRALRRVGRFERRSWYKEFASLTAYRAFRAREGRNVSAVRAGLLRLTVGVLDTVGPIKWVLRRGGSNP